MKNAASEVCVTITSYRFSRISRASSTAARKFFGDTKLFVNGTARKPTPSPSRSPLPFAAAVTSQPSERSAARYGRWKLSRCALLEAVYRIFGVRLLMASSETNLSFRIITETMEETNHLW